MKREKKVMVCLVYITIFFYAFGYMIYSALIPAFMEKFQISLVEAGMVGSALSVGGLVMLFFSEPLSRRFAQKHLLVLCAAAHVVSILLIALTGSFTLLLAAFFLNGIAGSLCNVFMSAYISDSFPEKRNSYLNLFHGIYGIGALAGPILPTWLMSRSGGRWELSYVLVGGLSALLLIGMLAAAKREAYVVAPPAEGRGDNFVFRAFRSKPLLLICLCTFLFMGENMTMATWMASYMEVHMGAAKIAGIALTFYWSGAALGRVAYPILFARVDARKYLLVSNALCAAAALMGMLLSNAWVMFVIVAFIGLLSGVNFPLDIALACEQMPEHAVSATNAVCFFGSIGGIVFPLLGGWLIANCGYPSMLLLIAALLICTCVLMGSLIRRKEDAV